VAIQALATKLHAFNVGLPISVIVPVRNEAQNLARCLESLRTVGEIWVVDSQSSDGTVEIANSFGAQVVQFHYQGGWPKKRQWALDTLPLGYEWVLLLDADEALTPELEAEMRSALRNANVDGYYIGLEMVFLGRRLRHSGASFYKLSLFRRGRGRFECRSQDQDTSMCDMEVHEHVLVSGKTSKLKERLLHRNVESLSRYIRKHDEYSNWEVLVARCAQDSPNELNPALFGTQAQRRRWLRKKFFHLPGSSVLLFLFRYVLCMGVLDGMPGLIYCGFQAIQFFHVKAKLYEASLSHANVSAADACELSAAKD
jgi:glycosyltransferase involved in cell wall biosynthesis